LVDLVLHLFEFSLGGREALARPPRTLSGVSDQQHPVPLMTATACQSGTLCHAIPSERPSHHHQSRYRHRGGDPQARDSLPTSLPVPHLRPATPRLRRSSY
jgi:hypothetical protein